MPQYWSKENRCAYCPAESNTSHDLGCINQGMYDERGSRVPFTVYPKSEQLMLDFEVTPHIRTKRVRSK